MTKQDLITYLQTALRYRSRTSYKYYFLKAIIHFGKTTDTVNFFDAGVEMIVQSWNDLSEAEFNFRKLDKLKEIKIGLIQKYSLPEFMSFDSLRNELAFIERNDLVRYCRELTAYCPYLLLSMGQWDKQLKGIINYHEKNQLIKEFSQNESCLYEIQDDYLILNSEFFDIINHNLDEIIAVVNQELKEHLK